MDILGDHIMNIKNTIRNMLMKFTIKMVKNMNSFKKTLLIITAFNLLIMLPLIAVISYAISPPQAQQAPTTTDQTGLQYGLGMLGAGLAIAGSCIGAGIAVSGATSAGAAAIVERPGTFGTILIFAGLGEGIAIYGLLVAFQILGKIP
jgi:V/A-type H+-transporting ATPase subunit K